MKEKYLLTSLYRQLTHPVYLFLLGMLALAIFGQTIYIPDSYEYYLLADCLDGTSFLDCSNINMVFRPPLLSFFLWPLPLQALPILCMISIAASAVLLAKLTKVHAVWVSVLAIYCTQHHPILADARIFIYIFLFGAWALLFHTNDHKTSFLAGLLAGLTVWVRPEAQIGILFFVCYAFFTKRQFFLSTTMGLGGFSWDGFVGSRGMLDNGSGLRVTGKDICWTAGKSCPEEPCYRLVEWEYTTLQCVLYGWTYLRICPKKYSVFRKP